jgi:hypothetical protein
MNLSSFMGISRRLVSNPVRYLDVESAVIQNWMEAMKAPSFNLSNVLYEREEILPRVDVELLLNPLGEARDASSTQSSRQSRTQSQTSAHAAQAFQDSTEFPYGKNRRAGWLERESKPRPEKAFEPDGRGRASLVKAKGIAGQPVPLLVVLQRYASLFARGADGAASASRQTSISTALEGERKHEAEGEGRKKVWKSESRAEGAEAKITKILRLPLNRKRARVASVESEASTAYDRSPLARFGEKAARRLSEWSAQGRAATGERAGFRFARAGRKTSTGKASTGADFETRREIESKVETLISKRLEHETASSIPSVMNRERRFAAPLLTSRYRAQRSDAEALMTHLRRTIAGAGEETVKDFLSEPTPAGVRLSTAIEDVFKGRRANNAVSGRADAESSPLVNSLERIVEKLVRIETKFSKAVEPLQQNEKKEDVAVRWMEDDDLAGRLQKILRRQARRRGINLT